MYVCVLLNVNNRNLYQTRCQVPINSSNRTGRSLVEIKAILF